MSNTITIKSPDKLYNGRKAELIFLPIERGDWVIANSNLSKGLGFLRFVSKINKPIKGVGSSFEDDGIMSRQIPGINLLLKNYIAVKLLPRE